MSDDEGIDLSRIRTYSLRDRRHLVERRVLAKPTPLPAEGFEAFLSTIPDILAGRSLRDLLAAMHAARRSARPRVWGLGAHVIKVGLTPLLVELIDHGFVTALVMNGAAAIHDAEMAMVGATSEDVAEGIRDGSFGMARETAAMLNGAARKAAGSGIGLGEAVGRELAALDQEEAPSLLRAAFERGIPATVHVAIGQDIVHMHADADGAAIGAATMTDFRKLAALLGRLSGGVYLNVGSAVALPEVFLKALCLARNLGHVVEGFTAANLDMLVHYRPRVNVVQRPGGTGIDIRGHHELLIPLLRWGLLAGAASHGGGES
ncbi:MAG: hypothetical protein AB1486_30775 [Planctomycetota bacterium]